MGTCLHWPNFDAFPIELFRRVQLSGLAIGHGGIEDIVIVSRCEVGSLAQDSSSLTIALLVHQIETIVNIDIWLRGSQGLGTLEPTFCLLIAGLL